MQACASAAHCRRSASKLHLPFRRLLSHVDSFVLLLVLGAAVLGVVALAWAFRGRGAGRAAAGRSLCGLLDSYLDGMALQQAAEFDAQALWGKLEQARAVQRAHFPELFAEMMEVSRTQGELTELLLRGHMERHGAPTNWSALEAPQQLAAAHARVAATVHLLQARCRTLTGGRTNSRGR